MTEEWFTWDEEAKWYVTTNSGYASPFFPDYPSLLSWWRHWGKENIGTRMYATYKPRSLSEQIAFTSGRNPAAWVG